MFPMAYYLQTENGSVKLDKFNPSIHMDQGLLDSSSRIETIELGDILSTERNVNGLIKHFRLSIDGQIYVSEVMNGDAED